MTKMIRFLMALLLMPATVLCLPDRTVGQPIFVANGLAINSWHYHYSFHRPEVVSPGKGTLIVSKTTPETEIQKGLLLLNGKIISLEDFLPAEELIFRREVDLEPQNRLHVFLWGTPGAAIDLAIDSVDSAPAPAALFSADPGTISIGETSRLVWETENADRVSIDNGIGDVPAIGFVDVSPLETTTYTLMAEGSGGTTTKTALVAVNWPPPQANLTADPASITVGDPAVLYWDSEFAQTCTLVPDIGTVAGSGSIEVYPDRTTTYTITAVGPGGTATAAATVSVFDSTDPPCVQLTATPGTVAPGGQAVLSWTATGAENACLDNGIGSVPMIGTVTVYPTCSTTYTLSATGPSGSAAARATVSVIGDPAPLPEGSFGQLYEDRVPFDATVDAYDPERFALVSGQVRDENGNGLPDVAVAVHSHPEYGTCRTDADGRYALPVEGGGMLTLVYRKNGYVRAQRQVIVPWNDIAVAETLALVALDTASTTITFDGNPDTLVTHQSTAVADESGVRACALVFSGDNRAYLVDESGADVHELETITVRATEFTTPASMPAVLPPVSAYTYCVELSVDGADRVRFDRPVTAWVDNFIGFAVGDIVPVGYYDRDRAAWVPWDNGVVVKLLDTDLDGVVDAVDADGDDLPDDLDADGVFFDEVAGLDDLLQYPPGATFWKFTVDHFTPFDCNWPFDVPDDATGPKPAAGPFADVQLANGQDCPTHINSFVADRSRIFHEDIPIPGTDVALHYSSSRTHGHQTRIRVPASGASVPDSLVEIVVEVRIAGQVMQQVLPPQPYQHAEFEWDGTDAFGNPISGTVTARIRIGFVYPAVYARADGTERAFAKPGTSPTFNAARQQITLWMEAGSLPVHAFHGTVAEGWTLSPHHRINPAQPGFLHKGDGTLVNTDVSRVIDTLAAFDSSIVSVTVDPAGTLYAATAGQVFQVYPDGSREVVAGTGSAGFYGDGGPAVDAGFRTITKIRTDDAGNLYVVDSQNFRIRKIDPAGMITTIAGNGVAAVAGDNGPATDASLQAPRAVAADDAGNLYVIDGDLIRQIDPAGMITTIGGGGDQRTDGAMAAEFRFNRASDIAVDSKGNLFVADYYDGTCGWVLWARVLMIDPTGLVTTAAGGGCYTPNALGYIYGITVDLNDTLYVAHWYGYDYNYNWGTYNHFVTRVSPEGKNILVAGKRRPADENNQYFGFSGDGGAATQALMNQPVDVAVTPAGIVYIADQANYRCRMVAPPRTFIARMAAGDLHFPEKNGTGHIFSSTGLHRQTIDLDTGVVLAAFEYNQDNHLTGITDGFGSTTTIQYNGSVPTAIVSPDGVTTALTIDADNRLTEINFADSSGYRFEYTPAGLMTTEYEPAGNRFDHDYDGWGRLTDLWDAEGGNWRYVRTENPEGDILTEKITAEGNGTTYLDCNDLSGRWTSTITDPAGDEVLYERSADGLTVKKSLACGLQLDFGYGIDPEYKFTRLAQMTETTPAGLTRITAADTAYADTDGDGVPDRVTGTVSVNDKPAVFVHDVNSARKTAASPEGRTIALEYDPDTLRPVRLIRAGFDDTTWTHDDRGRLVSVASGLRQVECSYDGAGNLDSVTGADGLTTTFGYDAVGRITAIGRPDNTTLFFDYDPNGNLTVLTTPSAVDHTFGHTAVNQMDAYQPPISGAYHYLYDRDRNLIQVALPSGNTIDNTYENGRLTRIRAPEGDIDLAYGCGGRLASVTSGTEAVAYAYDGNLVVSETLSGTLDQTLSSAWNSDFTLDSMSYAGNTQTYTWDSDGLICQAGDYAITRNPSSGLPETVTGSGFGLTRNFNGWGEVHAQTVTVGDQDTAVWQLTYDANGRITEKTETMAGATSIFTYAYDALGRLLSVSRDGVPVEEYAYDDNGNRISGDSSLRGLGTRNFSYDAEDRLVTAGSAAYAYDADGFLTEKTIGADVTRYDYSARGELLEAILPDGRTIEYLHDPLGRRIAKKIDGTIAEKYLWQGLTRLLAVYDGIDNLILRFEYADGRMPVAMTRDGSRYYLAYDQVGSLRVVADGAGTVVKRVDYDTFGNIIADSDPAFGVPFGFAGGLFDPDTGLVHFGYRDYDPDTGRWTAKDPIFFAGGDTNLYGYVLNDPVGFIDPDGAIAQYVGGFLTGYTIGGYLSEVMILGPVFKDLHSQEKYYRKQLKNINSIEGRNILENALKKTVHHKAAVAFSLGVGLVQTTWDLVSPHPKYVPTNVDMPCEK